MTILLDTDVLFEWSRPHPDARLAAWLAALDESAAFVSVATLMELRAGIERLMPGKRRDRLTQWLDDDLALRFETRIVPVDAAVAVTAGRMIGQAELMRGALGPLDALLAATAEVHAMTLATRKIAVLAPFGLRMIDPFA